MVEKNNLVFESWDDFDIWNANQSKKLTTLRRQIERLEMRYEALFYEVGIAGQNTQNRVGPRATKE